MNDAISSDRDLLPEIRSASPVALKLNEGARTIDTAPLMAMAGLLIINSHLEHFYPRAFLAADGLLGNSLFFLLSGFGLQMSAKQQSRGFASYCRRRLVRLYPTLFICEIAFGLINHNLWQGWHPTIYFHELIYPTGFTYFRDIVPFYLLVFPILSLRSARMYTYAILFLILPYLCCYLYDARQIPWDWHLSMGTRHGYMHDIAYLQVMLLGGWFAIKSDLLGQASVWVQLGTAFTLLFYFGLKYMMVVRGKRAPAYGLLHLLVFIACGCLLMTMTDRRFLRFYRSIRLIKWSIALIAGLTLQTYIVHSLLIEYDWLSGMRFPINILVLLILTLSISYVIALMIRPLKSVSR